MPFPVALDSTMLSAYKNCPTSFKNAHIRQLKLQGQSIHLHAGGTFASGLEAGRRAFYIEGKGQKEAELIGLAALEQAYGDFECPQGSVKTLDRMLGALEFYYENYPFSTDPAQVARLSPGVWGVEFSFAIPLPFLHPDTGNPLLFAGRADAVVNYANGLYILDEKTTSQLGPSWSRQWDLRSQFTAYAWALRHLGLTPAGSIVRGISILAESKTGKPKKLYETQRAIVGQPQWKIDRWEKEMHRTVSQMLTDYKKDDFGYDLGDACNSYGGCSFKTLCSNKDQEPWVKTFYEKNEWSPLTKLIKVEAK